MAGPRRARFCFPLGRAKRSFKATFKMLCLPSKMHRAENIHHFIGHGRRVDHFLTVDLRTFKLSFGIC